MKEKETALPSAESVCSAAESKHVEGCVRLLRCTSGYDQPGKQVQWMPKDDLPEVSEEKPVGIQPALAVYTLHRDTVSDCVVGIQPALAVYTLHRDTVSDCVVGIQPALAVYTLHRDTVSDCVDNWIELAYCQVTNVCPVHNFVLSYFEKVLTIILGINTFPVFLLVRFVNTV